MKKMFRQMQGAVLKVSAVALAFVAAPAMALAQGSSDPTTGIITTLTTYGVDVGLLATAVLLIFYGKRLVSYLKV